MDESKLFPVSIVDDITHCIDKAYPGLVLNYAWMLTLEGEVSTEILLKSLDKTMDFYPKSRCIITDEYPSYKRWFRYCWKLTECTARDIFRETVLPADTPFTFEDALTYYVEHHASLAIDLSSHIPLKVLLFRKPGRAYLFFIMHHAAADGLSGFFFIQQLIRYYEDILYGRKEVNAPAVKYEDMSLPDVRFRWRYFSPRRLRPFFENFFLTLKEPALNTYPGKTRAIIGKFNATVRQLPPDRMGEIKRASKQYGATVNDYLLAAMFQTVKKWCREWIKPSDRIYINVPMSLRSPEDRTLSNILSGVTASLQPGSITVKEEMLPLIRKEIAALTASNIAETLIYFSALIKPLPIVVRRIFLKRNAPSYAPTIVLSNMGILSPNPSHKDEEGFHFLGDARIRDLYGMPAVGAWPMLLLYTYNDRMIFNMSFLESYFPPETAARFMDSFLGEL
jgi:NRPS condensation-like uncharacterized protein